MAQEGTTNAHPAPPLPTPPPEEEQGSLWAEALSSLLCALDALFNALLAVRQPMALLRGLLLAGYVAVVVVRPYFFHPRPFPEYIPFPYFLLLEGRQGWELTFQVLGEWWRFFVRWEVLQYWAQWLGPVVLAWWISGGYLARIFGWGRGTPLTPEEAEAQARQAVLYRAFAPWYFWVLPVMHGQVQDERSPLFWLGGPGRVQVATDSAAVWEAFHSGDVHIIMPCPPDEATGTPQRQRLFYPVGFERLRRILDLRQQHLEFDLHARTRDGVRLVFPKVRAVYSLRPAAVEPTPDCPYPRDEQAIRKLLASEGGRARSLHDGLPLGQGHAVQERRAVDHTTSTMRTALRRRMKDAIAARTLPEVLAAIAPPDAQKIEVEVGAIVEPHPDFYEPLPPYPPMPKPWPNQMQRYLLTTLLRNKENYHEKGLHLYWADASDWDIPGEGIKAQFMRAWQLSRENARRGAPGTLEQLRQEAYLAFLSGEFNRWAQLLSDDDLEELAATLPPSQAFERRLRRWLRRLRALAHECLEREVCCQTLAKLPLEKLERMAQFLAAFDLEEPGHRP